MIKKDKTWNEAFAKFFESPSREGLRNLLRDHHGETHAFDFKEIWPSNSKLSRQILGLANYGGGCLIVGVKENKDKTFEPVGLDELSDKTDIQKGIERFVPIQLEYSILDFSFQDSEYPKIKGKKYQALVVEDSPKYLPFLAKADGEGLRKNAIYYRHATNADVVFHNFGGTRTDIDDNISISMSTIYEIWPFDNTIKMSFLKGAEINRLLTGDLAYSATMDSYNPDTYYLVATNDYLFDKDSYAFKDGLNPTYSGVLLRDLVEAELLLQTNSYSEFLTTNDFILNPSDFFNQNLSID